MFITRKICCAKILNTDGYEVKTLKNTYEEKHLWKKNTFIIFVQVISDALSSLLLYCKITLEETK